MIRKDTGKEEQERYARVLDLSAKFGFFGVVISYFIYIFNVLPSKFSGPEMEKVWTLGPEYYRKLSGVSKGFGWVSLLGFGDFFMLIPIVFLSSVTLLCYFSILPVLLKKREFLFVAICVSEIMVLLFAAVGWQAYSGH